MPRDYPIPNDIPIDAVAARTMQKGVEFVGRYKPDERRMEAPLKTKTPPEGFETLAGQKRGDLTIIGYVGNRKWLCRCVCGYYVTRKNRFVLRAEAKGDCQECNYRDFIKRRAHFGKTGVWTERRNNNDKQ